VDHAENHRVKEGLAAPSHGLLRLGDFCDFCDLGMLGMLAIGVICTISGICDLGDAGDFGDLHDGYLPWSGVDRIHSPATHVRHAGVRRRWVQRLALWPAIAARRGYI
jgi:hypothetical protein